MADLQALQIFAAMNAFNLTAPLDNDQVRVLAEYWLPNMRFDTREQFHPISLEQLISMVEDHLASLSQAEREALRVSKFVETSPNFGETRRFDPPVVHVPGGIVIAPNGLPRTAVRVLNDGSDARPALAHPDVDDHAVITHGTSLGRSRAFFGGNVAVTGPAGDVWLPRAVEPDGSGGERPVVTVLASYQNLIDALEYELKVKADKTYPPDALRGGFDIAGQLINGPGVFPIPLPDGMRREFLLNLIANFRSGTPMTAELPPGWSLNERAWEAVTRYAFLEYDFVYAYNDFERYQVTPFDNEHEGDDEGCCLVFDRALINVAAGQDDDALRRAVPYCLITAVHEEVQAEDKLLVFSPPLPPADDPGRLPREDMDVTVYIAGGSHATYLTAGEHDLVDMQDTWAYIKEDAPILLLMPDVLLTVLIIVAALECITDTVDFTSEDGVHSGPDEDGTADTTVAHRVVLLPMSADRHIYQDIPEMERLLRLRSYPGRLGGHNETVDISPNFQTKTGRYFRRLLRHL